MPTALAVVLTILPGQSNRLWPCRVPYYSDWRKCVGIEQPKRQGFQMFQTCVYCTVCDVWLLMFHTDDTSAPGARLCGHPPALVAAGHLLLPLMKIIRYTVGERPQTRRLLMHITQRDILMKISTTIYSAATGVTHQVATRSYGSDFVVEGIYSALGAYESRPTSHSSESWGTFDLPSLLRSSLQMVALNLSLPVA